MVAPFALYLADFGLSRLLQTDDGEAQKTQSFMGPVRWMAPESLFDQVYSTKSDSYMYAMFLYEVLFRNVPFFDVSNILDVTELVAAGKRPALVDNELPAIYLEVFTKCWSVEPSERFSLSEIVQLWNRDQADIISSKTLDTEKNSHIASVVVSQYTNVP